MKFGVSINNCREGTYVPSLFSEPNQIIELVQIAENLGFYSIWGNDHLTATKNIRSNYPSEPNLYESIVTTTYLAGITNNIHLGIGNIALPLREPVLLAKQTATLDVFSGGRLMLGVGLGSQREEFLSVYPKMNKVHRGKLLEEQYEALYLLLTKKEVSFMGEYIHFNQISVLPKPIQNPPSIYITGEIPENAARVAKWGTGWSNNRLRENITIRERWELLMPLLEKESRDPKEIDMHTEATLFLAPSHDEAIKRFRNGWQGADFNRVIDRGLIGTPAEIVEKIWSMKQDGLTHILGIPGQITSFQEWLEQVQLFGEEVLPNFS